MDRIRNTPGQAGFTLVESMVAMFILAYIVTQMLALTVAASRNTNLSKRTTTANQLADEAIEKSRNTAYDNLQLANTALGETCSSAAPVTTCTSTVHANVYLLSPYTRVRTITPRTSAGAPIALASSNQADIAVTVSFTDARGTVQTINVASIVSRY
jgi:prepilin-type N-terminal cleavage/methylation domain-containing protein